MADTITLILIITSTITFLASCFLLFYDEKIGLPVGEWVALIFISFVIMLSQIVKIFKPELSISSELRLLIISLTIFILAVKNYWEILSEYDFSFKK